MHANTKANLVIFSDALETGLIHVYSHKKISLHTTEHLLITINNNFQAYQVSSVALWCSAQPRGGVVGRVAINLTCRKKL